MAGVEPKFTTFEGKDPAGFALSVNINRRHLNKGQRAMATAMVYPEPEQGKRKTSVKITEVEVNQASLSHARTVLRWLPELAPKVMAVPLSDAYQEALKTSLDHFHQRAYSTLHSFRASLLASLCGPSAFQTISQCLALSAV